MNVPLELDHIVFAVPDLAAGVDEVASRVGVRPSPGGSHPGLGTRNFLLSLGDSSYLEIIGPDPEQGAPQRARPFGLDQLTRGRLVTWAIHVGDLEARVAAARKAGFDPGPIMPLSRQSPTGLLQWRLTLRAEPASDGMVPFLIDWGGAPNPATTSARGSRILGLRAEHPEPDSVRRALTALGAALDVSRGPLPALIATLSTPQGSIELR
jgi:hypothetical protein